MPEAALILLLIVIAAWAPGRLAVRRFGAGEMTIVETHFAALTLGMGLTGWLAFLLAEVGAFSIAALSGVWLAVTLALAIRLPQAKTGHGHGREARLEAVLLGLWLPVALWLFLRPHETILGAADAGVYVSTAAHIARQGAIVVYDATLAHMDPLLQAAILRPIPDATLAPAYLFPGFNVIDASAGSVLPDFFHYHPVWLAVAFALGDLLGGTELAVHAALMMPGLWALLGAVAIYLTLRRVVGALDLGNQNLAALVISAVALGALSICALQVWFARYPVSETLTQYLIWSGLWAMGAWLAEARPRRLWGLLAGVSTGLLLLTRIDTLFILALPALAFLWQIGRGRASRPRRASLWFYGPLIFLALHMTVHGALISRPYFGRITAYAQVMVSRFWPALAALIVLFLAAGWLLLRYRENMQRPGLRRALQLATIVVVAGLAAYGWFVRPVYGALPSYSEWYDGQTIVLTDRENLVRLGWYLSPAGVWLGIAGICLLIWRANRRTVTLLGVGLFFAVLYLWRIQANPHQIYVMRRYVPVVAPFLIVGAASLLFYLWARPGRHVVATGSRVLAFVLAAIWLAGMAWSARGFVTQVDYRGLTAELAALDAQLGERSVLLFDEQSPVSAGDALGTPLHFLFGHDVYTLRAPQAVSDATLVNSIKNWQNNGRSVYWVGAPDWLQAQALVFDAQTANVTSMALEGSYDHKPQRIMPVTWNLSLNLIAP